MTQRNGRPVAAGAISRNATASWPSRWLTALRTGLSRPPGPAAVAAVRLIAVVGLGINGYVHLDLASGRDLAAQHRWRPAARGDGNPAHPVAAAGFRPAGERGEGCSRITTEPAAQQEQGRILMAGTYRPAASSQAGSGPRRMLRRGAAACGLAAAMVVVACSSPGGSTARSAGGPDSANPAAAAGAVSTRQLSGIGTALVDSSGKTIYTPKTPQEANGTIKCAGPCLSFWFPVTASPANPGPGGLPGELGTIRRSDDGKTQLTYNGKPLYTFRLDTAAGQAHGSNFTDTFSGTSFTWQVVTASSAAGGVGSPAPAPSYSYQAGY
jgi:predicted lipoprotein with Yx(FWY)xxD motif